MWIISTPPLPLKHQKENHQYQLSSMQIKLPSKYFFCLGHAGRSTKQGLGTLLGNLDNTTWRFRAVITVASMGLGIILGTPHTDRAP